MKLRSIFFLVCAFAFLIVATPAHAQSRSVTVPRRDIDITILTNGDVQVKETWQVKFSNSSGSKPFTFAFLGIRMRYVNSIDGFAVSESGRAYQRSGSESAYNFQLYQEKGQQFVRWYFPETSNSSRTFNIQ